MRLAAAADRPRSCLPGYCCGGCGCSKPWPPANEHIFALVPPPSGRTGHHCVGWYRNSVVRLSSGTSIVLCTVISESESLYCRGTPERASSTPDPGRSLTLVDTDHTRWRCFAASSHLLRRTASRRRVGTRIWLDRSAPVVPPNSRGFKPKLKLRGRAGCSTRPADVASVIIGSPVCCRPTIVLSSAHLSLDPSCHRRNWKTTTSLKKAARHLGA